MVWCQCERYCHPGKDISAGRARIHAGLEIEADEAARTGQQPTASSSVKRRRLLDQPSLRQSVADTNEERLGSCSQIQDTNIEPIQVEDGPVTQPSPSPSRTASPAHTSTPRSDSLTPLDTGAAPQPELPDYSSRPDEDSNLPPDDLPEPDFTDEPPDEGSLDDKEDEDEDEPEPEPEPTDGERPSSQPQPQQSMLRPELQEDSTTPVDLETRSGIAEIDSTLRFAQAIQAAGLEGCGLSPDAVYLLRNPTTEAPQITRGLRWSLSVYLNTSADGNGSQKGYRNIQAADGERGLPPGFEMLSHEQVEKQLEHLSGVSPIERDMCINSCMAFTGPQYEPRTVDDCVYCGQSRWDPIELAKTGQKVPRLRFSTIPLGPQLQARHRHPETAKLMQHRALEVEEIKKGLDGRTVLRVKEYGDVHVGSDLLERLLSGEIKPTDSVVMLSIDGAQLYRNKASDCWIQIWILLDLSPEVRYKKVHIIPGCVIPGPNKPKNLDSFLYPGLYHLAALQNEGLHIWDAATNTLYVDHPFLAYVTADTPAMAMLNGLVGHHGRFGCRFYCGMPGRHKAGAPMYFPAAMRPKDCPEPIPNSMHEDYDIRNLKTGTPKERSKVYQEKLQHVRDSPNETDYKKRRAAVGVSRPSIFLGVPRSLGVPALFTADLMHLIALNLADLLLGLWRGTLECDTENGDHRSLWDWMVLHNKQIWEKFGAEVAAATPYFPTSFGRAPRNPALKINSGYKAAEFLLLIFGLCVALLRKRLPLVYWLNFCRLVYGVRILYQHKIAADKLKAAHKSLVTFAREFEAIYYRGMRSRIHFCRHSVHQLPHLGPLTTACGPLCLVSQWAMERMIGDLGRELRQPGNPFANLTKRAVVRAQVNNLKSMIPNIEPVKPDIPRGAEYRDDGYVLLRKRDTCARAVSEAEAVAIRNYYRLSGGQCGDDWKPRVMKWARLRLPDKSEARSAWTEKKKALSEVRMARMVKLVHNGVPRVAEVQYYFDVTLNDATSTRKTVAMVSLYDLADAALAEESLDTLHSFKYRGDAALAVVDIKAVQSIVAMVPFDILEHAEELERAHGSLAGHDYFLVEHPGLEVLHMSGIPTEQTNA
ncbi:unnamed protein product [Peniophora sp. CBMAI 1063]|nr:unnamed protein product [Peniophora sp. CBMAI 1063]